MQKGFTGKAVQQLRESEILTDGIQGPFEPVRSSRFCRVTNSVVSFHGFCHKLYLKEYLYRSVWDVIKHFFRPSRAERAFTAALMLEENGLCSPEIVAAGRFSVLTFCKRTFLLTKEVGRSHPVYSYFSDIWSVSASQTSVEKRNFIKQLAATVGKMHACGIFHGDLRAGNILARDSGDKWRFYLLDNERTKKFKCLPDRLRVKNLVQLNMLQEGVNQTDRIRFFKAYMEQQDFIDDGRLLLKAVLAKTAKRRQNRDSRTNASGF